jgi:hypothetical protein
MFERDDRRENRHLRRSTEDLRAVDDVPTHDLELRVGELVGLVQDLLRGAHLADVVHERRQAEFAQEPPFDPERPRLAHGQDRHVHHVRERVVVVVAHRGQRDERGAILRDRVGQAFDGVERCRQVRLSLRFRALPGHLGDRHGVRIQLPDRRHVAADAVVPPILAVDSSDLDVRKGEGGIGGARFPEAGTACMNSPVSFGVTPRSNAIRSILWSLSRLMSSDMPRLAFAIGVSATTSCCPTMPTAIDGCVACSSFSTASRPSTLRAISGWSAA